MTAEWISLFDRLLDGGALSEAEKRDLRRALDPQANRREAAEWLRFEDAMRRKLAPPATGAAALSKERLLVALSLGDRRASVSRRRFWWMAVAAAALVVAFSAWLILRDGGAPGMPEAPNVAGAQAYPAPMAAGSVIVAGGGPVARGATLTAAGWPATLVLGGYCKVEMSPGAVVTIAGEERKESVRLDSGKVACSVVGNIGTFGVSTRVGTVSVRGTEFSVEMDQGKGESAMLRNGVALMMVTVMLGAVDVAVGDETVTLFAGQGQVFAAKAGPGGTPVGVAAPRDPNVGATRAVGDTPAKPTAKTDLGASKVTFNFQNTPLSEVNERLAEMSGNKAFRIDDRLKDREVTLSAKNLTYWEAVDKVAASLGLICTPYMEYVRMDPTPVMEVGLQLVEADKDAKLTGYTGPCDVKVDSVAKIGFLRTAKVVTTAPMQSGKEGLAVALTGFWENRLDPIMQELEITKVRPSKGDSLLPEVPEERRKSRPAVIGLKPLPCLSVLFNLPMPSPDARFIAELSGVMRLEFASGEREVTIDDIFDAAGKEIKVDDWTIVVKKVNQQNGILMVTIDVMYKGQVVDMPPYWTAGGYGWYVEGEGVRRTRGITSGGWGPKGGPGGGPGQKVESLVSFQGDYGAGASVVLVLPKVHETKEYPFTIKDVPLP